MKKTNYILIGLIFVALGSFWLLRVIGVIPPDFTLFFDGWWTLFIIVPCALGIITSQEKALPALGLLLGVMLLLAAQGVISWAMFGRLIVPVLVIVIGLFLLLGGLLNSRRREKRAVNVPPENDIAATFSERTADFSGRDFTGASLTAVFGKVTVDLRRAMIAPDAVVNVYAVFGSVDILLPESTRAAFRVVPILGAAGDRRMNKPEKEAPALNAEGTVMFGSVNVR